MEAVNVLVGHDHHATVPERLGVFRGEIDAKDGHDVSDLVASEDLGCAEAARVQELSADRENAVKVTADDVQAAHRERLRAVAFGDDKRALIAVLFAGHCRILELWNAKHLTTVCRYRQFFHCPPLVLLDKLLNNASFLHNSLADFLDVREGPKQRVLGGQRVLLLRIELWVLYLAVDEDEEVLLHVVKSNADRRVCASDSAANFVDNAVENVLEVRAVLRRECRVHKADAVELFVCAHADRDFPSGVFSVDNTLGVDREELGVLFEASNVDKFIVEVNARGFAEDTCEIHHSALEHSLHVLRHTVGHVEHLVIWKEGNLCVSRAGFAVFAVVFCDHWAFGVLHVLVPLHLETAVCHRVIRVDGERLRKDICELCTVTVTAPSRSLDVVIVIR